MRVIGGLSALLFGTGIVIVQPVATALTPSEIANIARQITVRIDGANTGSGVIIERQGNVYTVVTNWHVVQLKGNYTVHTPDGQRYTFNNSQVKQFRGVDLAVFQFTSNQNYRVAEKGNSNQVALGTNISVAGYPQGTSSIRFLRGSISSLESNPKEGYAFVYDVGGFTGMSGGAILDDQGKLVGIHGRATTRLDTNATTVYGIPLRTYISLAPSVQPVATAPTPKPNIPSACSTSLSSSRTLRVYGLKLFKATPKELIDEIWQIIQRQYIDGTFNQVDWLAVRKEYLSKSYSSTQEACQSAQKMLKKLGDPNTKLINREKFQQFPIGRDLVDIGIYERIEINPVEYSQKQSLSGKVGYIYLKQFSQNAAREMQSAIRDLEKQQVSGYILDLRGNSGGLLSSSVEIAQMWLDRGTIVSTFDRTGEQLREVARGRALTNKPLVILVNQGSAGASEILAAALQDNRRAVLVGNRTFGKNTMQSIRPLEDGSFLALTIVRYDTPNGRNINKSGIIPDVNVELTPIDRQKIATLSDPQYSMALSVLQKQIVLKLIR